MSQLISYVPAQNGTVKQQGAKLASAVLAAAAAAATAVISDGGAGILTLTAAVGTTADVHLADSDNGHQFSGQPSITITGAGAVLTIEWL